MDNLKLFCLCAFFSLSCFTVGISVGVTLTPGALSALVALVAIVISRISHNRPVIPGLFFQEPAVVCAVAYIVIGITSGLFAANFDMFVKEVVQRLIIIIVPIYIYALGPRKPRDLIIVLLSYIPSALVVAIPTILLGAKHGFREPVYLWDLHKNAIGHDCANLVAVCAAMIIAKLSPKLRPFFVGLILIGFLGMVASQARAATVGTVLSIFLMLVAARARARYLIFVALVVGVGFFLLTQSLPKETLDHAISTERFSSNGERSAVWAIMWKRICADPFMCYGWGNQLPIGAESYIADAASIFFLDWGQMSVAGVIAQFCMVGTGVIFTFRMAMATRGMPQLNAISLAALSIFVIKFFAAYLDSFWVGRGPVLSTFVAIGMAVYVKQCLMVKRDVLIAKRQKLQNQGLMSARQT